MSGESMPRFFFDIDDGSFLSKDEDGHEFTDMHAAQIEAKTTLSEMMRDRELQPRTSLMATIRDEDGSITWISLTMQLKQ
jgi:hypothetical protein